MTKTVRSIKVHGKSMDLIKIIFQDIYGVKNTKEYQAEVIQDLLKLTPEELETRLSFLKSKSVDVIAKLLYTINEFQDELMEAYLYIQDPSEDNKRRLNKKLIDNPYLAHADTMEDGVVKKADYEWSQYYRTEQDATHGGDCTAMPASCGKCHYENYINRAIKLIFSELV